MSKVTLLSVCAKCRTKQKEHLLWKDCINKCKESIDFSLSFDSAVRKIKECSFCKR